MIQRDAVPNKGIFNNRAPCFETKKRLPDMDRPTNV